MEHKDSIKREWREDDLLELLREMNVREANKKCAEKKIATSGIVADFQRLIDTYIRPHDKKSADQLLRHINDEIIRVYTL